MAEDEDNRLLWSIGLPNADDLTPLTLQLIPSELASAFKISPESSKTVNDVNRASENTFSSLQRWHSQDMAFNEETVTEKDETEEGFDQRKIRRVGSGGGGCVEDADSGNFAAAAAAADDDDEGSDPMKFRRVGSGGVVEDADSGNCAAAVELEAATEDDAKMLKRARLVWTPQLHKRFIEVVAHLGIKNAVPKTIMQLMNVEGLTRENVASHLQKYRLYLKRQLNDHPHHHQGNSNSSEQSRNNNTNGHGHVAMNTTPMVYPPQQMMGYGGGGQPGFQHQYHNQYGNTMMQQQQREWSGNNFGYYHPVASNDK